MWHIIPCQIFCQWSNRLKFGPADSGGAFPMVFKPGFILTCTGFLFDENDFINNFQSKFFCNTNQIVKLKSEKHESWLKILLSGEIFYVQVLQLIFFNCSYKTNIQCTLFYIRTWKIDLRVSDLIFQSWTNLKMFLFCSYL